MSKNFWAIVGRIAAGIVAMFVLSVILVVIERNAGWQSITRWHEFSIMLFGVLTSDICGWMTRRPA